MKPLPHTYTVQASAAPKGNVELDAEGLPTLLSAPPVEYDGPGDLWSPETLLIAAVVDCFVLTFRAIARASRLEWTGLRCQAQGTLDRAEGVTRFVAVRIEADLEVPASADADAARRQLEKAERTCLITQSLKVASELHARVTRG
jgi:organic hydroperoxide reductase OsmC/OhrA